MISIISTHLIVSILNNNYIISLFLLPFFVLNTPTLLFLLSFPFSIFYPLSRSTFVSMSLSYYSLSGQYSLWSSLWWEALRSHHPCCISRGRYQGVARGCTYWDRYVQSHPSFSHSVDFFCFTTFISILILIVIFIIIIIIIYIIIIIIVIMVISIIT